MRELRKLNIKDVRHLARHLGSSPKELLRICQGIDRTTRKYYFHKRIQRSGDRTRDLFVPTGRLRQILDRLRTVMQRVSLPGYIQGGTKGRSYITNAARHVGKPAVLNMDLEKFFDNITYKRVYRLFRFHLGCSPDVARILTRLTTLNGCVPQGSPTSSIVAAFAAGSLGTRVELLARKHGAESSILVDDISVSGPRYMARLARTLSRITEQEGYRINSRKTHIFTCTEVQVVTGVRVDHGLDVPPTKVKETLEEIRDLDPLHPDEGKIASIKGRIRSYIAPLNRGTAKMLSRTLRRRVSQ